MSESIKDNITILPPAQELCDVRISATKPTLYYAIPVEENVLITFDFQEFSAVGRCELLLSFIDTQPSRNTASWKLLSPESSKRLVIHPADYSYISRNSIAENVTLSSEDSTILCHEGTRHLYVCVHYLSNSGSSFFRLVVHLKKDYYSTWYCQSKRLLPTHSRLHKESLVAMDPVNQHIAVCENKLHGNSHRLKNVTAGGTVPPIEDGFCSQEVPGKDFENPTFRATTHSLSAYPQGGMYLVYGTFYAGAWKGLYPHGRGAAYYALLNGECSSKLSYPFMLPNHPLSKIVHEQHCLSWSARTLPQDPTLGGINIDDAFLASFTGVESIDAVLTWAMSGNVSSFLAESSAINLNESSIKESGAGSFSWEVITLDPERHMEAYVGDWKFGKKHGRGVYQWSDRVYIGEWLSGIRDGHGVLLHQDGSWYRGEWSTDRRHGYGEAQLVLPDSVLYKGHWVRGLRQGTGSLLYPSGVVVEGIWEADVMSATVHVKYPDKTVFRGGWRDGVRHGPGVFIDALGNVYSNTWDGDRPVGRGTVQIANGVHFEGEWLPDGRIVGQYRFPEGSTYIGEWDWGHSVREGNGQCIYKNGDVYEGEWHNNERHGKGRMQYHTTGGVYDGFWDHDKRCGIGTLTEDGEVYEGEFRGDERSGPGTQKYRDGSLYKGDWRFNHHAGYGVFYNAKENTTYIGVFLYNRLQGYATAVYEHEGKEKYEGSWLDGKQQGRGTFTFDNGDVLCGVWHLGEPQDGVVQCTYSDGTRYVGDWVGGSRYGCGTEVRSDGTVYDGQWAQNKPSGHGRLIKPDGKILECLWADGEIVSGNCNIIFPDGSVYCGLQIDGIPNGEGTLSYPDGTIFKGKFCEGIYSL